MLMRKLSNTILYLCMLFCLYGFSKNIENKSVVCVLMVKNEAQVMEKTLDPIVNGGITDFLIYDTGSTDDTVQITQRYFETHNITEYKIIQESFVNFGESRTKALRYAESFFPDARFMLMLDAEWYMEGVQKLLIFCEFENDLLVDLYSIRLVSGKEEFYVPRLIKTGRSISFSGKIHEAPIVSCSKQLDASIWFRYEPTKYGREKTVERHNRDLAILLEEYEQDPTNPRTTFYLAQTYDSLCLFDEAFKFYTNRTKLCGWDEENFMSWYRRGKMASILYQQTNDQDWLARAIQSFERAWQERPTRIEPAVALAELLIKEGNMRSAYIILKEIFNYKYPETDILFTEPHTYSFKRYELSSICAWYVSDYTLGKEAALRALQYDSELPYLHRNLALYIMKLEK